jgi:signal peptidase I
VLFLIGTVLVTMAVRLFYKRVRRMRQYLYFGDAFLLERFPGRVTLIPARKIVYSFERRRFDPSRAGTDLYFDTVVYRDGHKEVAYDLQDHYFHSLARQQESHDNIALLIKKRYAVKEPPPQSRFLQESF